MAGVFIRQRRGRPRHRETEETWEKAKCDGGGAWNGAATSQGMPSISGSHQKLQEASKVSPRAFRGTTVLPTP